MTIDIARRARSLALLVKARYTGVNCLLIGPKKDWAARITGLARDCAMAFPNLPLVWLKEPIDWLGESNDHNRTGPVTCIGELLAELKLIEHEAGSKASSNQPELANEAPDGPFGADGFRWRGKKYFGLTPRAFKLLASLWPEPDRTLTIEDAEVACFGANDIPEDAKTHWLHGRRKDANAFFDKHNIELVVKVSRHVGRVSLVTPQPKKKMKPKGRRRP